MILNSFAPVCAESYLFLVPQHSLHATLATCNRLETQLGVAYDISAR